jgi:hypothetical protein
MMHGETNIKLTTPLEHTSKIAPVYKCFCRTHIMSYPTQNQNSLLPPARKIPSTSTEITGSWPLSICNFIGLKRNITNFVVNFRL